jgi:hypothetical protein
MSGRLENVQKLWLKSRFLPLSHRMLTVCFDFFVTKSVCNGSTFVEGSVAVASNTTPSNVASSSSTTISATVGLKKPTQSNAPK